MRKSLEEIKQHCSDHNWHEYISIHDMKYLIARTEKAKMLEKKLDEICKNSCCVECGDIATEVKQGEFYCEECSRNA